MVDVNRTEYPDSSLADFSFLVPAPAGAHGFVTTHLDGHFYFANGKRARFYGVNVSSSSIPQPDSVIDATVARFRRAGLNMLRLEATDNTGRLLDTPVKDSSRNINAAYLRKMHRWMWAAKKNGLYLYLQLLDFRNFREGDDVPNADALGRAAKPYAFFDPRLIMLQKEFARQILLTENPYTKTKPINDPSVAVIELANEHGLFIKGDTWRQMPAPYDAEFKALWNNWLKERYGTTEALDRAWTSPDGKHALKPTESLEVGSVEVPDMSSMTLEERAKTDWTDPARSPVRVDDGARFAYDVQRSYFREMRTYLRGLGVKIPITCAVSAWIAPDVKSVADELDFTAENWYWDHPAFEPGKEWQKPFYYSNTDPLANTGAWNAPPYMSFLKWKGKPVIIREWAAVWPNEYRAASVPLVASYAAYEDLDGLLAFGYQFNGKDRVGDFNWERDPTRWGLISLGALTFLRGDVQPSKDFAEMSYSDKALFTWHDYLNDLQRLAFAIRVENVAADQAGKSGALLTVDMLPDTSPQDAFFEDLKRVRSAFRAIDANFTIIGLSQGSQVLGFNTIQEMFAAMTPRSVVLSGKLSGYGTAFPGFETATPYGTIWAASLDGKSMEATRHFVVKMVSKAKNTGEEFIPSAGPYYPGHFALKAIGTPPILTYGEATDTPTRFPLPGTPGDLIAVGMINGTWEMEKNGANAHFYCDTPGIAVLIPGAKSATAILTGGGTKALSLTEGAFTYPEGADRVEIQMGGTKS